MGKAVIAIHGGAGAISRAQMTPEREREYTFNHCFRAYSVFLQKFFFK